VRRENLVSVGLGRDARQEGGTHAKLFRDQLKEGLGSFLYRIEAAARKLGESA
jgi:hypothetical protein